MISSQYLVLMISLLFQTFGNQPQTQSNNQKLEKLLVDNFPANTWFEDSEFMTRFHQLNVEVSSGVIAFSYIKESKTKETQEVFIQKIERKIPFHVILENYSFEYHFGQEDLKYKGVWYRYFEVSDYCNQNIRENCDGAEMRIFELDPENWEKMITDGSQETGGETLEWNNFWIPTNPKIEKKLDQLFSDLFQND